MALNTMYFGTITKFQQIKAALSSMPAGNNGYSVVNELQNGGATAKVSFARNREFDISWTGTYDEVGLIKDYAHGYWGSGLLYIMLPHMMKRNVFPPNWAAPQLINVQTNGWPDIYDTVPATYASSGSSVNNIPLVAATYTVTNAIPVKRCVIPIPADRTLFLGHIGSVTGTGVVQVRPILAGGSYTTVSNLTPIAPGSTQAMNASYAGSSYSAVEVYLTATSAAASTVTVAGLMGQLLKTATAPSTPVSVPFQPGRGWSGFKFTGNFDESIVIDDDTANVEYFSIAATLTEVGQWTVGAE